jgi:predicted acetyltransferase
MQSAFGGEMTEAGDAQWLPFLDFTNGRILGATDTTGPPDQIVGTAGWLDFTMTVPGSELPAAAVTMVTVRPSHRRRGILRQLMLRQFEDAHAQGFPLATLWASESAIYQRFGYGLAFLRHRIDLDPRRARILNDPGPVGQPRMLNIAEALELLPPVYERARRAVPGSFKRSRLWWEQRILADLTHNRRGGGPHMRMALEIDGRIEGYTIYNVHPHWGPEGLPAATVHVMEVFGTSPVATRELWRYLLGLDLVGQIQSWRLGQDDPLSLLIDDPRQLRLHVNDGTWVRLIEIGPALTGRRYLSEGRLTFRLTDPSCPWNEGVWTLEAGPGGASLTRGTTSPDISLGAADLASLYLSTLKATRLQQAGRLEEHTSGAAFRADLLFSWPSPPWCLDDF